MIKAETLTRELVLKGNVPADAVAEKILPEDEDPGLVIEIFARPI
jgi:hypothetical protein